MITYWTLFTLPVIGYFLHHRLGKLFDNLLWGITIFVFIFAIGLRHHIGCDWYSYQSTYETIISNPLSDASSAWGIGFTTLNWLAGQMNIGIYGVNLICAVFFCWAVFTFCHSQPSRWIACLAAVPYLFVIVAMGYTRQSVALGFFLFALLQIERQKIWHYIGLVVLGSIFHVSVILCLPLALIHIYQKNRRVFFFILIPILFLMLFTIFQGGGWKFNVYFNPETARFHSVGSVWRTIMSALPASVLLLLHHRRVVTINNSVWYFLAWICIVSLLVTPVATTGFDRLNIYLVPIQLYAWARLTEIPITWLSKQVLTISVIALYGSYLFLWLNFSSHAICWVPYSNIFF